MDGRLQRSLWMVMILFFACSSFGCIGVGAHLIYWMKGTRVEPEYTGLAGKRVAVICMSDAAPYGPDLSTQILTKHVQQKLIREIKKIELVSKSEIEGWKDTNNWDQIDYLEIGKGVQADVVIAIELSGYSLQQGTALYRGSTSYSVQVYDLNREQNAKIPVFGKGPVEFSFPENHPIPISASLSTNRFEQMFMTELGEQISHYFCGFEMPDRIASDASSSQH
ncbi:MAG: hypothetical protein VX438_18320 [Planctomycetota bacterium]|nr:hypothetical protein [Planctomycetota bacterium]